MACLVDTGILLRGFDKRFAEYQLIRSSLRTLWARQEQLYVAVQNLAEFWNASTRPVANNGFGLPIAKVAIRLAAIQRVSTVITETDDSFLVWKDLLQRHSITGVAVHDARLVAVMQARGIQNIFTLNERDFRRYAGITILTLGTI